MTENHHSKSPTTPESDSDSPAAQAPNDDLSAAAPSEVKSPTVQAPDVDLSAAARSEADSPAAEVHDPTWPAVPAYDGDRLGTPAYDNESPPGPHGVQYAGNQQVTAPVASPERPVRTTPRVSTIVWGVLLVVFGGGTVVTQLANLYIEPGLVLIAFTALAGLLLIGGAAISGLRREKR
ncbi:hypothetical protein LWF01_17805 [Saxibacter everestensis]|uniref:DUF308 domain-containing protein n=1 Tax=Saxibacter everestensis TaxID=2909229 RepID=A0ABY8QSF5_9MICO|nr:hypothetical protein LWF01_17805 [Brevibacteriaceae bacterium ZFBP1038]